MEFCDAELLVQILRNNCPVDSGTLKYKGIQAVQTIPGGWRVQIGIDNDFSGKNPSHYVYYTEYKNRSSIGWIKRSVQQWAKLMMQKYGT